MEIFDKFVRIFKKRETIIIEDCYRIREAFDKFENLIKQSVIDFSVVTELVLSVKQMADDSEENSDVKQVYFFVRENFKRIFANINLCFEKQLFKLSTYYHFVSAANILLLFLISYYNKTLIEIMFEPDSNFLKSFFMSVSYAIQYKEQHDAIKTLVNFYSGKFIRIFIDNSYMELYVVFKDQLLKKMVEKFDFHKFSAKDYNSLMKQLFILDFDLKSVFEKTQICSKEDKPLRKFNINE